MISWLLQNDEKCEELQYKNEVLLYPRVYIKEGEKKLLLKFCQGSESARYLENCRIWTGFTLRLET